MRHKLIALLMAALLVLLTACGASNEQQSTNEQGPTVVDSGTGESEPQPVEDTLKIAYNNADSLEPYSLRSTMNQNMVSLLYEPLVRLDTGYAPQHMLAQEVRVEGLTCVVTLRQGLRFSDRSPITAADVVYSAQQAMASTAVYRGQLANVTEVAARDDGAVVFTLAKPDVYFENLLTFPIVKAEAAGIGSGRYVLAGTAEKPYLSANPIWHGGNTGRIQTIELVNQLDKDTLIYSLKLGTINYAYADSAGGESTSLGVSTQQVPLNQMVYLGMNAGSELLRSTEVRAALNLSMNRVALADEIYGSAAAVAYTPFHPLAREISPRGYTVEHDVKAAQERMAEAGYTVRDSEGYYVTGTGRLRLRLLVNIDNAGRVQAAEAIRRACADLGIEVTVDGRLYEEYKMALSNRDFDLYLGATRLYDNMDFAFLLSPRGTLGYGVVEAPELTTAYEQLRAGTITPQEFTDIFYAYTPFLPLLYRSAIVAFSRGAAFNATPTEQDIFYNIENW